MKISIIIEVNGEVKKFKKLKEAKEYLETLKTDKLYNKLLKVVNKEEAIRDFLVEHDYKLPLGHFSVTSYKGMTESYTYDQEICYQYSKKYPDVANDYQEIQKLFGNTLSKFFYNIVDDNADGLSPCKIMYFAKFDVNFESFKVETIEYEE